jgi:hypothetical protein
MNDQNRFAEWFSLPFPGMQGARNKNSKKAETAG